MWFEIIRHFERKSVACKKSNLTNKKLDRIFALVCKPNDEASTARLCVSWIYEYVIQTFYFKSPTTLIRLRMKYVETFELDMRVNILFCC